MLNHEIQRKSMKGKVVFITGVNGQDGAYLSSYLVRLSYEVHGSLRSPNSKIQNLEHLSLLDKIVLHVVNLEEQMELKTVLDSVKPDFIFNFAAQSSVKKSFEEPFMTIKPNISVIINLLEYLRENPSIKLFQASSSEMFGNPISLPVTEIHSFNPISPYGISKVIGHQLTRYYRENYDLFVVNGIMFNHESYLRDEGFFLKKLIKQGVMIQKGVQNYIELGNIDVKRDFGFSADYVKVMYKSLMLDHPDDYIICSGESTSLRTIVYYVFDKLGLSRTLIIESDELYRPNEIRDIFGDNSKIKSTLSHERFLTIWELLDVIIEEELNNFK